MADITDNLGNSSIVRFRMTNVMRFQGISTKFSFDNLSEIGYFKREVERCECGGTRPTSNLFLV